MNKINIILDKSIESDQKIKSTSCWTNTTDTNNKSTNTDTNYYDLPNNNDDDDDDDDDNADFPPQSDM